MTRILILTAGFGEGHNAAARNLAGAIERLAGPGSAPVIDLLEAASPRLTRLFRRFYYAAINGHPRIWRAAYAWTDRCRIPPRHLWLFRAELRALAALLADQRPAAVCCTYPVYAFLLEHLARNAPPVAPWFNIVTDSISIHSMWARPPCAGWFVPNRETADILQEMGVPAAKIHALGFPVPAFFDDHAGDLAPPELADGAAPRVLYMVHSGVRHARSIARRLIEAGEWDITLAVGRDARLRRQLEQWAAGRPRPAQVLGWTDQVPRLLMTHHILVSKAGGATTQEAIAARCPLLVNQIVPGQEEGNYELLRRHNVGAYTPTPDAVISELRLAFANGGAVWHQWRAALSRLARPDASRVIARRLLAPLDPLTASPRPDNRPWKRSVSTSAR